MAKTKSSSKKGQGAIVGIVVAVLVIAVMIFTIGISMNHLMSPLQEITDDVTADPDMSNESKEIIQRSETHFQDFWDDVVVFCLVMLWVANIVSAFFVDSHPVFFIITVLLLVFAFFVVADIANEYEEMVQDDDLAANQQYFTKTRWIMSHLLEICIVMAASFTVPIYAKLK